MSLLYPSSSHYLQKYSARSPEAGEVSQNIRRKTELCSPGRCSDDDDTLFLSGTLHCSNLSSPSQFFSNSDALTAKNIFRPEQLLNLFSDMYFNNFDLGTWQPVVRDQALHDVRLNSQWQLSDFAVTMVQEKLYWEFCFPFRGTPATAEDCRHEVLVLWECFLLATICEKLKL